MAFSTSIPLALPRPVETGGLPDVAVEGRAFWQARWRIVATLLRQTFLRARFRMVLVVGLSITLWLGLFLLCMEGFQFLRVTITFRDTHDQTVRAVFGMFFGSLMAMLVFSAGIILYGSLFQSREAAFLLSTPARVERIFLHKFQEAVLFSSWGFLLLGSPMLLAHGLVAAAPWYYYLMLLPYMGAFVFIPSSLGAVSCLAIVRWLPRRRAWIAAAAGVLALAGGVGFSWWIFGMPEKNLLTPSWMREMLGRLQFTEQRLLPSWWLSSGLLEASRHQWSESTLFLSLLISNALFFRQVAIWIAGRTYRAAYSGLQVVETPARAARPTLLDRAAWCLFWPLPLPVRLLLVKDLRLFRRDPLQWSQFLIFFGLLALYFVNIRRFTYDIHYAGWVNMVSFLNVSVVGLLLSTFNTRFVFPMISLEGQRFWTLGLLPVGRGTILWSKFFLAVFGSIVPSSLLVLLSDLMLRVSGAVTLSHQVTCVLLSVGLSGIAVGLGAKLPNLQQQSPSRIAAGFGGTLNLVLSTAFILAVVLMTALPCHFYFATRGMASGLAAPSGWQGHLRTWLVVGTAASVALSALMTWIPMYIGFRAFRRMEF